jgi:hypothetical protein
VVAAGGQLQLALLEPLGPAGGPERLSALFYEPGTPAQVASELRSLGESVVAIDGPLGEGRPCDTELERLGVASKGPHPLAMALADLLADLAPVETSVDGVFFALHGRRLPARRHPLGIRRRIEQLEQEGVTDEGGSLWERRIEEVDAVAVALCAHRCATGDVTWVGEKIALPGMSLPEEFTTRGVLPPVERLELPRRAADYRRSTRR